MPTPISRFAQSHLTAAQRVEVSQAGALADQLVMHLVAREADINAAHVVRASSMRIQAIVSELLTVQLGFQEEVVITPEDGLVARARPDFVYPLSEGRKVMAEVERGGTTTNNHDLKDMWKAHIAPDVQHLILVVPNLNWKTAGGGREKPYPAVCRRIGAFFGNPRREVDVLSAYVVGYGYDAVPAPLRDHVREDAGMQPTAPGGVETP